MKYSRKELVALLEELTTCALDAYDDGIGCDEDDSKFEFLSNCVEFLENHEE